jgi:hypothetical protein
VPVIVWLRRADGGWTDLLEAGASAVLAEPYRSSEVRAALEALHAFGRVIRLDGARRPAT